MIISIIRGREGCDAPICIRHYMHKGREGGGQNVMIEIIISENDDNDGLPLKSLILFQNNFQLVIMVEYH